MTPPDVYRNRNRLYRNRERGLIAGVCAGIADWTGFNLTALRVIVVLLAIPFTAVMIIGYVALALLLPVKPPTCTGTPRRNASGPKRAGRRSTRCRR